ncbi:uncharacterized protein LOC108090271 [Drosophila ficusphila]|uniref:uncharacterized protein LOC108090271 n=1 Tax=Drosophila ficusphila TaxID=30025 RepID=UPI0007E6F252|nr:uncharacterized protein LOC108090271 [Drosophila ficusphila]
MANSRSLKSSNWPGILDSRHALKKFFQPKHRLPPLNAEIQERLPTFDPPNFAGAAPKLRPRMNSDWQLASDPCDPANVCGPKRVKGLRDRERKKLERKIWARPAKIVATTPGTRSPEKPEARKKPVSPRKLVGQAKAKRTKVNAGVPLKRKLHSQPFSFRAPRRKNILVVDAKRHPWKEQLGHLAGGAEELPQGSAAGREAGGQRPVFRKTCRAKKKSFGVPLCSRPTEIMGVGLPYSRQVQMRQAKLYQQPEYHDQYMRMLYQQQRHQQMYRQERMQQDFVQHPYSLIPGAFSEEQQQQQQQQEQRNVYSVPSKSPLKRVKAGKRMCGNFYYD